MNFSNLQKYQNLISHVPQEIFLFDNTIAQNISFQGAGCAISIASASILTKVLSDKKLEESKIILTNFINMVEDRNYSFDYIDKYEQQLLKTFSEINKFPMRSKCASMCWSTFQDALNCDKYLNKNNE